MKDTITIIHEKKPTLFWNPMRNKMLVNARIAVACLHDQKMMKSYVIFFYQNRDFFQVQDCFPIYIAVKKLFTQQEDTKCQIKFLSANSDTKYMRKLLGTEKEIASIMYVICRKYFLASYVLLEMGIKLILLYGTCVFEKKTSRMTSQRTPMFIFFATKVSTFL